MSPHSWYISSNTYLDIQYVCPRVLGAYMGSMHSAHIAVRWQNGYFSYKHAPYACCAYVPHVYKHCVLCNAHAPYVFRIPNFSIWSNKAFFRVNVHCIFIVYCVLYTLQYICSVWIVYFVHLNPVCRTHECWWAIEYTIPYTTQFMRSGSVRAYSMPNN